MKRFVSILLMTFFTLHAWADDLNIIDARRNIPLSDEDPVYKDYYLNGGSGAGYKPNLVVTAVRKLTLRDSGGTQSYGDLEVPVGQLRIIAVNDHVAVAREYKLLSRDENAMLEQAGIMVGDRIDLKNSFTDDQPVKHKKYTALTPADAAIPTTTSVLAPTPAAAAVVAAKPVTPPVAAPPAAATTAAPPKTAIASATSGPSTPK